MVKISHHCRFCNKKLKYTFANLGVSPLANSYLKEEQLQNMEPFFPLNVWVCEKCYLVQLSEFQNPENIFSDYAYFSSYSDSWLKHAKNFAYKMIQRFGLNSQSSIIEIASNDGYLLQYFKEKGIPVLGIEPAKNVAKAAQEKGIPTISEFFGVKTASKMAGKKKYADLLIGNNVLAHVPDLNDFVKGMKIILKPNGIISMEFPHLMQLMKENQFDTIYHEHFSYFSFMTVNKIFAEHGLNIFNVEELATHGGSLRIFACHAGDDTKAIENGVALLLKKEKRAGFDTLEHHLSFNKKVETIKLEILEFFIKVKKDRKTIAAYGAPAKGNTLLNFCGIRTDFIDYTVDRSPHKQGKFLPGSRIPIFHPDEIKRTKPDYLIILPWNLKEEIMEQMGCLRDWGGKFVTFIPNTTVFS
jgi:2-polyprenyl-3-methyl-5-hydroxy-6-metoxy-1,4-benzoquinol methylase